MSFHSIASSCSLEHIQVPLDNKTEIPQGGTATIIRRTLLDAGEQDLTPYVGFSGLIFNTGGAKLNSSVIVTYSTSCCDLPVAIHDQLACVTAEVLVTGNSYTNQGVVEFYLYNQTMMLLGVVEIVVIGTAGKCRKVEISDIS